MSTPRAPKELAIRDKLYDKMLTAQRKLAEFKKKYGDVIAIAEYWTFEDVMNFPLTTYGPDGQNNAAFAQLYTTKEATAVLKLLAENEQDPDWARFELAIREVISNKKE